ncbi:MAG: 2-C-methyl-D-erythritol 2,4-cyclodiphosphate synthase [Candidatus Neomarinimicrobiota bacterium]|nr:MAG: 2-C-methyl-D-erythritol 2,4-cyclodiphosphate synthase [Candidatus Neomarinimicrobiota bacterium]
MKNLRVGNGIDVHPFKKERKLILCGELIEYDYGLDGHSDADVATHAIIDSLLGASGLGDIGTHFPDSSAEYKDISSLLLLRRVKEMIEKAGFDVVNVDLTIVAQAPKLSGYISEMRKNIASILEVDQGMVSIKATTTNGLGFIGKGEGIAAFATCLLREKNG